MSIFPRFFDMSSGYVESADTLNGSAIQAKLYSISCRTFIMHRLHIHRHLCKLRPVRQLLDP